MGCRIHTHGALVAVLVSDLLIHLEQVTVTLFDGISTDTLDGCTEIQIDTTATGTDFPPGTIVTLTWDRGITAATPVQVTTDAQGAFAVSIFLLPHDIPGPRILTAGTPADPAAFPGVTADYLVVEGTGQPPGAPGDPGSVIFRR